MVKDAELQEVLRGMTTAELRRFAEETAELVAEELERAKEDPVRAVANGTEGSARDTAVQKLAAMQLRTFKLKRGFSDQEVGDIIGVSRQRANQLWHSLCPLEAARKRKSG